MIDILRIVSGTALTLLLPLIGFWLGCQMFMFSVLALVGLFLLILCSVLFSTPITTMLGSWISPVVSLPLILGVLAAVIFGVILHISRIIQAATENLSDPGNKALGTAIGLGMGLLATWLIVF